MKTTTIECFARSPLARACALAIAVGGLAATAAALQAATVAGTQIKNLATVTYEDAAGNVFSAQSNEAVITVAQVYSATLGVDVDVTAAAGQTVYLPYVLTNTGNGSDVFDLSAVNDISVLDDIESGSIQIFHDLNGSGEPDAGEPVVSSLTLQANVDNSANLIVAVTVPSTATANQTLGVTLNATAQNGTGSAVAASVSDVSAGVATNGLGGRDGLDSTNESLITVTNDAALVTTKTAVPDFANNQVSYTLTVRNNGNQPATNVVIFDGLPVNTTLVTSGVSGLLTSNLDTTDTVGPLSESAIAQDLNADGDIGDIDELSLGIDLNNDGDTADTGVAGIYAIDAELPAGSSVSLTFTVSYDPGVLGGGYVILNQGYASGDTDTTPGADSLVASNQVQTTISPAFGVDISDTGIGASAGVNDGGDDDGLTNDIQTVDTAAAGGSVVFNSIITNNGNADDIFELSANPGNFPAGTVFTFFDQSGVVQLADTNGSGVDSGVIAAGTSRDIIVRATLPANASGTGPFQATVVATSANDPTATPATDVTTISLESIILASVDLHNTANGVLNSDEDPLVDPFAAVTTFTGQTGTTVNIPLFIDNESGGSDSYVLSAGSAYDGSVLTGLLPGWSVEFFETDAAGNAIGAAISNTSAIPGGTVDYGIIAVISIPADATLAVSDLLFDNNGDGTDTRLLGNADADGDYPIFFQVLSANTGATDIKLDAIDVNATRQLSLVTPGSNQIEPGGSVIYGHTLANNGNVDEIVELSSSNSQAGWTHTISIDTNNDGVADTALGSLVIGGTIEVLQANGTSIVVNVTDTDTDGNPELTLEPSFSIPLTATVFAPANAAPAQVDTLTISADNVDATGPSVSVTDQTTVINGQVRLVKTVALDAACDGTADGGFAQVQTTGVAPGECAIWRVTAENQGAADAQNVTIADAVTAFSTYEAGSLAYCLTSACTPLPVTDAVDAVDAGTITGSNIVFYVGPGADATLAQGGTLVPGQSATAQFSVRVD